MNGYILIKENKFYSVIVHYNVYSYWGNKLNTALLIICEDELNDIIENDKLIKNDNDPESIKIHTIELDNIYFFPGILNNAIA